MADHNDLFGMMLTLVLGPHEGDGDWTSAQLRRGWAVYRERLMTSSGGTRPGDRPWAHWEFDLGERMPDRYVDRVLQLLELGELSDGEIKLLERRAHEGVRAVDWANHLEDAGAVVTGPVGAAERMRERRDADAVAWRRVLGAVERSDPR